MTQISTRAAARLLGIEPTDVTDLSKAGFLPEPERIGNRLTYSEEKVAGLDSWHHAPVDAPAVVVRMGPPVAETDPDEARPFRGLSIGNYPRATKAESNRYRKEAVSRWWPLANPATLEGLPIVATVSGFVGAVYLIDKLEAYVFGRARFRLIRCPDEIANRYLSHKLRLPAGPIAYRLPR